MSLENRSLWRRAVFAAGAVLTSLAASATPQTLQNDGFVDGAPASFQAGFITTEIGAARFVPTIACPCVIESVTVLFGGNTESRLMGVLIWDDPGSTPAPGDLLFSGEATLTGSTVAFNEIDLSLAPIIVNGPFRVGIEFGHDGLPGLATDLDGSIDANANFIFADIGGFNFWFPSSTLGVAGDFILRASIDNFEVPDADGDGVPDDIDNCQSVANPNQVDSNADGYGNACDTDLNDDCVTNVVDLGALRVAFFAAPGDPNWAPGADFNVDQVVNVVDLGIMRSRFFAPPGPSGITDICAAP